MRCGKGHDHGSVAEVRACYGQTPAMPDYGSTAPGLKRRLTGKPEKVGDYRVNFYAGQCAVCKATVPAHAGFVFKEFGGHGPWLVQHLQGQCPVTAAEARELSEIKGMQPRQATATGHANFRGIPQGYYATRKEHGIDFWFVRVPEDGKWQGYRFVRRIVGGGGSPILMRQHEQMAALHAILDAGVEAAGNLFADEMEQCKWCRKPLTRKASRELRCGSTCAGNRGLGEEWARLDALYEHQ